MPVLKDLLIEEMRDLLHAENQLVAALPKMAKAAHEPKLKTAFENHLEETKGHVERLKQAFELLGAANGCNRRNCSVVINRVSVSGPGGLEGGGVEPPHCRSQRPHFW